MDKQELYVAASRSREETFIYATPEIQTYREEIAPSSPHLREGIPHIGEAAERDRAQLAAHDEALRSKFSGLPTEELIARRDELRLAAGRADSLERQRCSLEERIERAREHIDGFEAEREAAQALPRRERREELTRIDSWEARSRRETARLEAELAGMSAVGDASRRELAIADQALAQRRELAIIAARISPPAYVKAELGERPSDPTKRKAWDRGVVQIERYRQEHGVKDPNNALGREAKRGAERARQQSDVAANPRGAESAWPGAARNESAAARQRAEHRPLTPGLPAIEAPLGWPSTPAGSGASRALDCRPSGAVWQVGRGGRCA
jgi:hypothetical protein